MSEQYNLPMVRENFVARNIKKIFQGIFNIRRRRRDQKRAQILAQRAKRNKDNNLSQTLDVEGAHKKVDIYEFQMMYRRGEIAIQSMNEDQKYALIKLFEMQNEHLKESIEIHKRNTEAYNAEVERLKRELEIIG